LGKGRDEKSGRVKNNTFIYSDYFADNLFDSVYKGKGKIVKE